ncbi:hypothetical protein ACN4EK_03045 [Pantanalinema rosaneae CENA516]|uniref:hypothetical protein n=1 Tax=Pantanalinema rosaneae TaxID=1620701 RepID=UPI003D6F7EF6
MPPTPSDPPANKLTDAAIRFFWGAFIGCFLALIPLSYGWYFLSDITASQIYTLVALGVAGGIVGLFSNLQQMGRFFDSIPWF